jgi:cell division protein FtsB
LTIDDKSNNKQKRNQKNNMSSTLKEALSEAMKEGGSWMNHMKQDYEVQLRTQKDMVKMYSKNNKKLEEENKKLKEEIRHLEDRAVADYDSHMNQYKEYKEYYDKWSPILTDIDGDEFCDLLSDYGWEYNDEGELVNICVDYEDDEVDYYIDAGRKVVLKDGRIVKTKD